MAWEDAPEIVGFLFFDTKHPNMVKIMTMMEQLQDAWEAKDLDRVLDMLSEDLEIRILHVNQTIKGAGAHEMVKQMVLDEETTSTDFRIIYENDECAVTWERIKGEMNGQVSIVQLFRDNKIYYQEVSLIEDPT